MIWLLPLIVVGGLFYPFLGFLVVAMMLFLLVLSFFAHRFWCWNLCPRGAFLDIVVSKLTNNRPLPAIFIKQWFRWTVFVLLMGLMVYRFMHTGGNLLLVGFMFVGMCFATTVISIALGMFFKPRGWCVICPMGFLQEKTGKMGAFGQSKK